MPGLSSTFPHLQSLYARKLKERVEEFGTYIENHFSTSEQTKATDVADNELELGIRAWLFLELLHEFGFSKELEKVVLKEIQSNESSDSDIARDYQDQLSLVMINTIDTIRLLAINKIEEVESRYTQLNLAITQQNRYKSTADSGATEFLNEYTNLHSPYAKELKRSVESFITLMRDTFSSPEKAAQLKGNNFKAKILAFLPILSAVGFDGELGKVGMNNILQSLHTMRVVNAPAPTKKELNKIRPLIGKVLATLELLTANRIEEAEARYAQQARATTNPNARKKHALFQPQDKTAEVDAPVAKRVRHQRGA